MNDKTSIFILDAEKLAANGIFFQKSKMGSLVKSLLRRLESTDKHVSDIRSDYANFESENSHSLKEAKRDIEEKSKALAESEAEGQALQAKNAKLRDNNERLQATIDEHRQVNEDLQNKLKQENKINQGTFEVIRQSTMLDFIRFLKTA